MGQRDAIRQIFLPGFDRLGEVGLDSLLEPIFLCVLPDRDRQPNMFEFSDQTVVPKSPAFGARRKISVRARTWITEAHWYDRYNLVVVKNVARDIHPRTEPLSTGVIPRRSAFVNANPGCLTDNQDTGFVMGAQDWSWSQRQVILTHAAGTNFLQQ